MLHCISVIYVVSERSTVQFSARPPFVFCSVISEMIGEAHSKTSSQRLESHSDEIAEVSSAMKEQLKMEKNKAKRRREDKLQASPSSVKKKKVSEKNVADLEELPAPEGFTTPAGHANQSEVRRSGRKKNTPQKSAEKAVTDSTKKWSEYEEMCIAEALLESKGDSDVDRTAFYQRAHSKLQCEVSNSQLYDKMRTMKRRCRSIQCKLKEKNILEDKYEFKTTHERALFMLWKKIWIHQEHIAEIEAENPRESDGENPHPRIILAESFGEIQAGNPKPKENEADHSKDIQPENPNSKETGVENSKEVDAENPHSKEIEAATPANHNSKETEAESDRQVEVENPNSEELDAENTNFLAVNSKELTGVARPNGQSINNVGFRPHQHNVVLRLQQQRETRFLDTIENMLGNVHSKLEALVERSVSHAESSAGFRGQEGMGSFSSFVLRKMNELMRAVDAVEEYPGLDAVEAQELQKKWRMIKIQEVKMFSEGLELLNAQCRLFLKSADTSNDRH